MTDTTLLRDTNEQLLLGAIRADRDISDLKTEAESRERLIAVISHDLRGPLHTIVGASALLIEADRLGEEDARLASLIRDSGRRMGRMIEQILDFARARMGGGFQLNLERGDLGAICRQIATEIEVATGSHIDVLLGGDLSGKWDLVRLGEVISNLASNAVAHGRPGGRVTLQGLDLGPSSVAILVTNEGNPIPDDVLPVLFDPFRVSGQRTRTGSHLGLGLYIAREIVLAHGGTLHAGSADGTTTFTVQLPRGL